LQASIVAIFANLNGLQAIRGYMSGVILALDSIPKPARTTLKKVHVWATALDRKLPPSVSHHCLYQNDWTCADQLAEELRDKPGLTHFAIEYISTTGPPPPPPIDFVNGLRLVLEAGGSELKELSVRLAGITLTVMQDFAAAVCASDLPLSRLRVWCDPRKINSSIDEDRLDHEDALVERDVWSEAVPWPDVMLQAGTGSTQADSHDTPV
jgi:hypothetical protein